MIDEKKLIEELNTMIDDAPISYMEDENHDRLNAYNYALNKAISIIKNQPKVGRWIPVGEGQPEPSLNSVIGWDAYRERCVLVQYYMNDWILGNHESVKIIAWMPLPDPYEVQLRGSVERRRIMPNLEDMLDAIEDKGLLCDCCTLQNECDAWFQPCEYSDDCFDEALVTKIYERVMRGKQ